MLELDSNAGRYGSAGQMPMTESLSWSTGRKSEISPHKRQYKSKLSELGKQEKKEKKRKQFSSSVPFSWGIFWESTAVYRSMSELTRSQTKVLESQISSQTENCKNSGCKQDNYNIAGSRFFCSE